MRTEELKTAIKEILGENCYHKKPPKDIPYPYKTFFLQYNKIDNQYNYILEVHVWSRDIKQAENLANQVEKIDKTNYTDDVQSFDIDLNNSISIEDEDKELNHIRLLFNLAYYHKEG